MGINTADFWLAYNFTSEKRNAYQNSVSPPVPRQKGLEKVGKPANWTSGGWIKEVPPQSILKDLC